MSLLMLCAMALTIVFSAVFTGSHAGAFDGQDPPHAVTIDGKAIPDSSTTQPDKPIIFSKDSKDPKWGELKAEVTFDHAKHNTDIMHTMDGKTLTACVHCHHTEQPMPVASAPYLKKSERSAVLTAALLAVPNAQPVNSCRHCHFQPATPKTAEYPPKSVRYPRGSALPESGELTNDTAYHIKCISCHEAATARDSKLKAPQACGDCHVRKSAASTPTATSMVTPALTVTPTTTGSPLIGSSPTPSSTATPMPAPSAAATATPTPVPSATGSAKATRRAQRRKSSRRGPAFV